MLEWTFRSDIPLISSRMQEAQKRDSEAAELAAKMEKEKKEMQASADSDSNADLIMQTTEAEARWIALVRLEKGWTMVVNGCWLFF